MTILAKLKGWALAIGGLALALLAAWGMGKREGKRDAAADELQDYQNTRRRMDDAESNMGDEPDVLRDWLRERGKSGGNL